MVRRVAVLAGGTSSEHEVSLETSVEVLAILREGGHEVRPVLVTKDGGWRSGGPGDALEELSRAPGVAGSAEDALADFRRREETVFIGLHGPFGEDGTVQRLLEGAGIPYTGSGPVASGLGMDKELAKLAASKVGARCAKHEVLVGDRLPTWGIGRGIGYPCVVKPVSSGSSVGVTIVREESELEPATKLARSEDGGDRCMVEELVDGIEVTCAVVRLRGVVTALPLVSIEPREDFYDYRAKYESEETRLVCPADVPEGVAEEVTTISHTLYEQLGMRGVVRNDFIVRRETTEPVFLELNTLPGFTAHSLVPMAARAAGMTPLALLEAVLDDTEESS